MAATPLTTECRAVVERMRHFPIMEGHTQYLRKLIYEDSATVMALRAEAEGAGADADTLQKFHYCAATLGNAGEYGGNISMWPVVQLAADALAAALDVVEAADAAPEHKRARRKP